MEIEPNSQKLQAKTPRGGKAKEIHFPRIPLFSQTFVFKPRSLKVLMDLQHIQH